MKHSLILDRVEAGKAITGAAELAGALGMGALAFFDPMILFTPGYTQAMGALALTGLATEAGAIASALTSNRGQNLTTRQAAAFRQIVYGTQRIGGTMIWRSTTGHHKDQLNYVIVLATHELWAITDLYLDGRQVFWNAGSGGHSTRNGYGFGGSAAGGTHTGPDGNPYDFGGKVYCEARFGTQAAGDVIGGLTANDPNWAAGPTGSPYVGGCAYVYLKLEYDTGLFPTEPEIRFTVMGKPVLDPRTGTKAYSHNPALIINDILTDPLNGINDPSVNPDQLVAAANICEEQVQLINGFGGYEDRYAGHWHYDTSLSPGDAIGTFLETMGGRLSRIGGEWHIFPAVYSSPVTALNADDLSGVPAWSSQRPYRERFNRVTGTYTAPNYPYNVSGNLYDANGYYQGGIQNNFPFAFQPSNYPMYACDVLHGYASDQYLNEDGGKKLPKEMGFPAVLSVSQAQRLAKIALKRNRRQGTGTLPLKMRGYRLQPGDTFLMTFAQNGWAGKALEVLGTRLKLESGSAGSAPMFTYQVSVGETDPSDYEWSTSEELTPYDVPSSNQVPRTPAPPTNMALISGDNTALVAADGTVTPRIEVTWDTPLDARVTAIQIRYRLTGAANWIDAGSVSAASNVAFLSPMVSGLAYDVQIRSQRANGAISEWVEVDNFTAGLVFNTSSSLGGIAPDSLVGEAYTNGTAAIDCQPFTHTFGPSMAVSYFPGGAVHLPVADQQALYYVYVVDPAFAGGNLTPVATKLQSDFLGKLGYWLIGSIVTPYLSSSGASSQYLPSVATDIGSRTTISPDKAFDNNLATSASVSGIAQNAPSRSATGVCVWSGFPPVVLAQSVTLSVTAATFLSGDQASTVSIDAQYGASSTASILDTSANSPTTKYSISIPAGTDLSTLQVTVSATVDNYGPSGGGTSSQSYAACLVYEIVAR